MKSFSLFCLIGALAFCFSDFAYGQGKAEAAKFARQGAEAAKNKDWEQAVEAYQKAAELDPKNAPNLAAVLQQRAVAYTSEQKYPEAIADFDEAIKMTPNDAGIYERRAYVEMRINDLDKALADYSEAIKLKPNEVRYYLLRSYIYEIKGDIKNSMADTEKVLKMQKGNAEAKSRKERLLKIQSLSAPTPPATPIPAPSKSP